MNALNIAFTVYLPVLIGCFLVIITCLLAGRRSWSRGVCILSLAINGLLLLLLTGLFLQGVATTGWYHGDAGMAGAILFFAFIPIALEFAGLLVVAWRFRLPRRHLKASQR
jgi:hypothetical protein